MSALQVNFVSADRVLWEGEASYVSVTTTDGALGILPRMAPMLATLADGPVDIKTADGGRETTRITGGFVSIDDSVVTILADDIAEVAA